ASSTQIVPVIVGSAEAALAASERLRQAGYWATAIRPPTVPPGTARLRVAFNASHQGHDVDRLLEAFDTRAGARYARAQVLG
ncbi:MAG: aminotransferase class I/II-fold pyridoxal phosphate-dependent enzyme, partial [Methyloceanibacter sp.]